MWITRQHVNMRTQKTKPELKLENIAIQSSHVPGRSCLTGNKVCVLL